MVTTTLHRAAAAAVLLLLAAAAPLAAVERPPPCRNSADVTIWISPHEPVAGAPLRVLAVAETQPTSELLVAAADGRDVATATVRLGGPPWSLGATIPAASAGAYRIEVRRDGKLVACREVAVGNSEGRRDRAVGAAPLAWDRHTEAFYSAWIEQLFDAPASAALGFAALQDVLRDDRRNFLHDHLQLGEDDPKSRSALMATPDCADLPYFLRAYFAWKIGLPMGVRACSRGNDRSPPRCDAAQITERPGQAADSLTGFKSYARGLMDTVQSGSARTALVDEQTDFYPVALRRDSLRPGVIYADPYGHTLMIVKWVPQTSEHSGLLFAVDAQPDNSVGRKRFWEGTFLFAGDTPSAGPGFKAFRPLVRDTGTLRPLSNEALADDARFAPFSEEQAELSADQFYARLSAIINPQGLDPERAYEDTLDALAEQLQTRIGSVDNGESYMRAHPSPPVEMPNGAHIFETIGPWEDYATPSRDMRLIIAMNVLLGLPDRVVHHPELFVLDGKDPAEARSALRALHTQRTHERTIAYTRSDGSAWTLTLADLLARKTAFEMAYNPNDCVEIRWGAAAATPEYAPCRRHAPAEQRARMEEYRPWFREARRPPR